MDDDTPGIAVWRGDQWDHRAKFVFVAECLPRAPFQLSTSFKDLEEVALLDLLWRFVANRNKVVSSNSGSIHLNRI